MYKTIPLTKNKVAIVDDFNYDWLSQYKWRYHKTQGYSTGYATTEINGKMVRMHRLIMGVVNPKVEVDHKNGDGLHNYVDNLRKCNSRQNKQNSKKHKDNTSNYKGVYYQYSYRKNKKGQLKKYIRQKPWLVQLSVNYKTINIGYFSTAKEAAMAYDKKARELYGEFAKTNYA